LSAIQYKTNKTENSERRGKNESNQKIRKEEKVALIMLKICEEILHFLAVNGKEERGNFLKVFHCF
jgi:hypothetical protein